MFLLLLSVETPNSDGSVKKGSTLLKVRRELGRLQKRFLRLPELRVPLTGPTAQPLWSANIPSGCEVGALRKKVESPLHYPADPKETAENEVIMEKLTPLRREGGRTERRRIRNVRLFRWCVTASRAPPPPPLIELSEAITESGGKIGWSAGPLPSVLAPPKRGLRDRSRPSQETRRR